MNLALIIVVPTLSKDCRVYDETQATTQRSKIDAYGPEHWTAIDFEICFADAVLSQKCCSQRHGRDMHPILPSFSGLQMSRGVKG